MTKQASGGPFTPPSPASSLEAVSSDGVRLHVEIHGRAAAGVPSVVLLHGWTCSTRTWAPVIRMLRDDLRVIVYDQRGHGRSSGLGPAGASTGALVDDLTAVLDAVLAPGERAVLAGHSMGGMAVMAAAGRPEVLGRVSGALLASTGCQNLVSGARVISGGAAAWLSGALHRHFMTTAGPLQPVTPLTRAAISYGTLGPSASSELKAVNADIICGCDRKFRAAWGRVLTTLDVADAARKLDVPTRVLAGSADRLTPPPQSRRIAAILPRCERVTELPGIGHMTPLEAPDRVAGEILAVVAGAQAEATALTGLSVAAPGVGAPGVAAAGVAASGPGGSRPAPAGAGEPGVAATDQSAAPGQASGEPEAVA